MHSSSIQKLIDAFSRFPTVGPRTAARFAFYLIHLPEEEINKITQAISDLRKKIQVCSLCSNPFEKENDENQDQFLMLGDTIDVTEQEYFCETVECDYCQSPIALHVIIKDGVISEFLNEKEYQKYQNGEIIVQKKEEREKAAGHFKGLFCHLRKSNTAESEPNPDEQAPETDLQETGSDELNQDPNQEES